MRRLMLGDGFGVRNKNSHAIARPSLAMPSGDEKYGAAGARATDEDTIKTSLLGGTHSHHICLKRGGGRI